MATEVFRVEKTRDYTIMSNHHLKNIRLSLKSKGLLTMMLSLPEDWDYTLRGLSRICREGIDAIRTSIKELVSEGYIECSRERNAKGQFISTIYMIHENPVLKKSEPENAARNEPALTNPISDEPTLENPILENPMLDNPMLDNPTLEKPMLENPTQLNTNTLKTKKLNTKAINNPSINHTRAETSGDEGWIDRYECVKSEVREQIDYDTLSRSNDKDFLDEIVNVMTEVLLFDTPSYKINGNDVPAELVKICYRQITFEGIETFLHNFNRTYRRIKNPRQYLISALYNTTTSTSSSLSNRFNCDVYGGRSD